MIPTEHRKWCGGAHTEDGDCIPKRDWPTMRRCPAFLGDDSLGEPLRCPAYLNQDGEGGLYCIDEAEHLEPGLHKARPADRTAPVTSCTDCKELVRQVPGGNGMVWVHDATGMVAGRRR